MVKTQEQQNFDLVTIKYVSGHAFLIKQFQPRRMGFYFSITHTLKNQKQRTWKGLGLEKSW